MTSQVAFARNWKHRCNDLMSVTKRRGFESDKHISNTSSKNKDLMSRILGRKATFEGKLKYYYSNLV